MAGITCGSRGYDFPTGVDIGVAGALEEDAAGLDAVMIQKSPPEGEGMLHVQTQIDPI